MTDSEFHRIKRLPPYVFAEVNAMKARARAAGEDIIDFGMGNPDLPTPQHIVESWSRRCRTLRPTAIPIRAAFRACGGRSCGYYKKRFNVTLDPESEAIVTIGSKEGLANLAQAITAPAISCWCPTPATRSIPSASSWREPPSATCRSGPGRASWNAGRGGEAHRAQAAGRGAELPLQPDGRGRGPGLLPPDRGVLPEARHLHPVGSGLFRDLFRRRSAALHPGDPGRGRSRSSSRR